MSAILSSSSNRDNDLDIVKRAIHHGSVFHVNSLSSTVTAVWFDPVTKTPVVVEGVAFDGHVTLYAANLLGGNRLYFIDQIMNQSVLNLINERMTEQLENSMRKRLGA